MAGTILLTGATGYIGGRLLTRLENSGHRIRCFARRPEFLQGRISSSVEIMKGDVFDPGSLVEAMRGVETAYYLVHTMGSSDDFEELDPQGALNFGRAAREQGVRRIIYLGGLGDASDELSPQLRSRQLVGKMLAEGGVPLTEFRSSIIIGSGSLVFETVRAHVERLPVMTPPKWARVSTQPIAVGDVLDYLSMALESTESGHTVFEIGGSERVTYDDLLREYAGQRGIRRLVLPLPFFIPRLSSLWLGLVTPVYARIGRMLIESLSRPAVVLDQQALRAFRVRPKGPAEAIAEALRNEDREFTETHWWHSLSAGGPPTHWGGVRFGNRLVYQRRATLSATPGDSFAVIQRVGGRNGWYYANWLWELRGFFDLLAGGVGLRRGRRHPSEVRVGDVIDWWRVESFEPGQLLLLHAEMKLPGRAWLEFTVENHGAHSELVQTAIFDPVGLLGLAYWYGIYPLHALVFRGMLRNMVRIAEQPPADCEPSA